MYSAQITKDRIKTLCKQRKVDMKTMLSDCSLGINAIRQINDSKGMSSVSLAKIADYLGCSVDYLLGRTGTTSITNTGDVNGNNNILGQVNGSVAISGNNENTGLSELEREMLKVFKPLDTKKRMELIQLAYSIAENKGEKN